MLPNVAGIVYKTNSHLLIDNKLPNIIIEERERVTTVECSQGMLLLKVLHLHGYEVYSPCGGKGSCGKCTVYVKGLGMVNSCTFHVDTDIVVVLPDKRAAHILTDQHRYAMPLDPTPGLGMHLSRKPHGVAVDIGTTTLVFYLVDLSTGALVSTRSLMNPQVKFGADVISRINYSATDPQGQTNLQQELISAINDVLTSFVRSTGVLQTDIVRLTMAGNTTMLHLLLGVDALPIALAPFRPAFIEEQRLTGSQMLLVCHPDAEVIVLPSIAAYVGADIVAGLASIKASDRYRNYLFVDIGTNGEMALVTPERIWCCATAAGPAFEGANISCGMSAVEGAINAYDANGYSVIGNHEPAGICGSGLIDVVAHLLDSGVVTADGTLVENYVLFPDGNGRKAIIITQQDIRELQLAKSAIMSGLKGLLRKAGMLFKDMDALFLAGGLGSYIDISNGIRIGLLPGDLAGKTISLGNASGTGAMLALVSEQFKEVMDDVRKRACHFDLSQDPDFMMDFVMNMDFAESE